LDDGWGTNFLRSAANLLFDSDRIEDCRLRVLLDIRVAGSRPLFGSSLFSMAWEIGFQFSRTGRKKSKVEPEPGSPPPWLTIGDHPTSGLASATPAPSRSWSCAMPTAPRPAVLWPQPLRLKKSRLPALSAGNAGRRSLPRTNGFGQPIFQGAKNCRVRQRSGTQSGAISL